MGVRMRVLLLEMRKKLQEEGIRSEVWSNFSSIRLVSCLFVI